MPAPVRQRRKGFLACLRGGPQTASSKELGQETAGVRCQPRRTAQPHVSARRRGKKPERSVATASSVGSLVPSSGDNRSKQLKPVPLQSRKGGTPPGGGEPLLGISLTNQMWRPDPVVAGISLPESRERPSGGPGRHPCKHPPCHSAGRLTNNSVGYC